MATIVMRPTGDLGDASNATYATDSGPAPGGMPALVELSVTAARLVESPDLGVIASVTPSVAAYVDTALAYTPACALTWKRNADAEATEESVALSDSEFAIVSGTTHAVNPWTGLPWTWGDVNDLRGLGATVAYAYNPALGGPVVLQVAEVYVTVVYADRVTTDALVAAGGIASNVRGAEGVGGPVTAQAVTAARGALGVGGPVTTSGIVTARGMEGVA